jgi:DNA-binding LytR/AlgR family response regulator
MALYKFKKDQESSTPVSNVKVEFNDGFIFVKSNGRLLKLNTEDIYYIEALKDYVVINTIDARYTIHSTMKEIEKKMGSEEFLRIHRLFIVRIDKISAIEHPNLHLENNKKTLPIGGSYYDDLKRRIKLV